MSHTAYVVTVTAHSGERVTRQCASVADVIDVLDRTLTRAAYCPLDCWQSLLAVGMHTLSVHGVCDAVVYRVSH